jgi:hypothetical protein
LTGVGRTLNPPDVFWKRRGSASKDGTLFERVGFVDERGNTLEQGSVTFYYRPRVEQPDAAELADVQRLLVLLSPSEAPYERLVAIGRKRFPTPGQRFWGFVDLVLDAFDMQAALGAQVYGTKTRGMRHLPAAEQVASGTYEIAWHDEHAHLRWTIEEVATNPIAAELALEATGDWIVTIANPDPAAWGVEVAPDLQAELFDTLEVHVTLPAPFPETLQRKFRGRRYAALDSTAWLNHPGAELMFIASREQAELRLSAM